MERLRVDSNSIDVSLRIYLFDPRLVANGELDLVELNTPGQLDVDVTRSVVREDPTVEPHSFVRYLFEERDKLAHSDFQAFLKKHRLSSYVRVAARREGVEA